MDVEGREGVERTPTKRTKFHPQGVDLSTVNVDTDPDIDMDVDKEEPELIRRRTKRNDMSAFMALRPSSGIATRRTVVVPEGEEHLPEEEQEYLRSIRQKRKTTLGAGNGKERRKEIRRRDWTCRETVWGSGDMDRKNKAEIDRVSFMEAQMGVNS